MSHYSYAVLAFSLLQLEILIDNIALSNSHFFLKKKKVLLQAIDHRDFCIQLCKCIEAQHSYIGCIEAPNDYSATLFDTIFSNSNVNKLLIIL